MRLFSLLFSLVLEAFPEHFSGDKRVSWEEDPWHSLELSSVEQIMSESHFLLLT